MGSMYLTDVYHFSRARKLRRTIHFNGAKYPHFPENLTMKWRLKYKINSSRNSPAEKQHIFGGPGFAVYRKCFD